MVFCCPFTIQRKKKQPKKKKAEEEAPKPSNPPPPPMPGRCSRENPCMAAYVMENLCNYPGEINIQMSGNRERQPYGGGSFAHSSGPRGRLPGFDGEMPPQYLGSGYGYDDYGPPRSFFRPPRRYNQMPFQPPEYGGYDQGMFNRT